MARNYYRNHSELYRIAGINNNRVYAKYYGISGINDYFKF